ncbi:unnamed protein product, partial [Prorocentrum cordatum]
KRAGSGPRPTQLPRGPASRGVVLAPRPRGGGARRAGMALSPVRIRAPWLQLERGEGGALQRSLCAVPAAPSVVEAPARLGRSTLRCLLWRGLAALCTVAALSLLLSRAVGRQGGDGGEEFELLFEGEVPNEDFVIHAGSVCFGVSESEADLAGYLRLEVESDKDLRAIRGGREQCTEWMVEDSLLLPEESDPRGLAFLWPNLSVPLHGDLGPGLVEFQEEPVGFASWGGTICGFEEYQLGNEPQFRATFDDTALRSQGRLIYVPSRGFLPVLLDGRKQVLVQKRPYFVPFQGVGHGLRYQPSVFSRGEGLGELVLPGSVVMGFACLDSEFVWAPEGGYLPLSIHGAPALIPMAGTRDDLPQVRGSLSWMLFDDQEVHWGSLQNRFNESTFDEKARASSSIFTFPAPPWNANVNQHTPKIREKFARHWHIVLAGTRLRQDQPRSRYRVSARKHLSSFGSNSYHPEKCPRASPLAWLRRVGRQGYDSFIAD